jgi:hypothetical protein
MLSSKTQAQESPCMSLRSGSVKKNRAKLLRKSKVSKQNSSEKSDSSDIDATDNITIEPTTSSNVELKDFLNSINFGKYFNAFNKENLTLKDLVIISILTSVYKIKIYKYCIF